MRKVDFIGVGPPKTSTTWIADNLRKHPDVFIPKQKEIHYFNEFQNPIYQNVRNHYRDKPIDWYHSFFKGANPNQKVGEFTVLYFESENCAQDIFSYNPNVKIIISLRNPIDKALSFFQFAIQKGIYSPKTIFEDLIESDDYILRNGLYAEGLERYMKVFPKNQIHLAIHDHLVADPQSYYDSILGFLDLAEHSPDTIFKKSNSAKTVRFYLLNKLIVSTRSFLHSKQLFWIFPILKKTGITQLAEYIQSKLNVKPIESKPTLKQSTREHLLSYYLDDIKRTEKILGIDLSNWKTV